MNPNQFYLFALLIVVSACAPRSLVVKEISVTEPEKYHLFKDEQLSLSTKDTVNIEIRNRETEKIFVRKSVIQDRIINNYDFKRDSLFIQDQYFRSSFGVKSISGIKFKGVWDDQLGFVSESKLNEYTSSTINWIGGVIGTIVGGAIGGVIGGTMNVETSEKGFMAGFGEQIERTAIGIIIGAVTGSVLGYYVISPGPDLEDAIRKMKQEQKLNQ